MRSAGAIVDELVVAPLAPEHLTALVADTFHWNAARAEPLARIVHQKTAGNPFFVLQFLARLYEDRVITFDPLKRRWDAQSIEHDLIPITSSS